MIDDRLSLSVTHADGVVTRWGPDEPDGQDVPNDLTFSDKIPGGFDTLSTSLLRRVDVAQADEAIFDEVCCYGPGNRTAWEGLMQQFPRTHGDGFGVSPGAVGFSSILRWDPSFREIYADADMSQWREATLALRAARAAASIPQGKIPVAIGGGGIIWTPPNESLSTNEMAEIVYDAGVGRKIGRIEYVGTRNGASWAGNFEAALVIAGNDELLTTATSENLTLDGARRAATTFTDARWLLLRARVTSTVTPAAGHQQSFTELAIYGDHGLALQTIPGSTSGVLASDVVADVVGRAAPQLSYTTGSSGSIEPTTFAIPHLVFRDPVSAEDAISQVNGFHLYDWGVYDNREFFYRQPDPDRVLWEARLSDGAHLDADGDTGEQIINGVFVTYSDATGIVRTVGPPGGSFDNTDSALEDANSSNPVNAHGLGRKWVPLNLSYPTTLAGATQIGYAYLQERSLAGRRGRVTLTGTATHPVEGKVPCWRVRSGDWISLKDLNGATVPRKIISKSYSHGSRQVVLDLDNTAARLDAILARVGIQAGIATGGGF